MAHGPKNKGPKAPGIFGMSAVYGTEKGLSVGQISIFVATIYAGGLFLQYPIGLASDWMDRYIWGGLARLVGGIGKAFSFLAAAFDEQGVNPISSLGAGLTKDLGQQISRWHSGKIQAYLGVIAAVFLFLLLILVRLP